MVELMVVITLLAIVLALAAPSFTRLGKAAAITSAVNQFLADMRFARSEAVRRGGGVVMCRSDEPESSSATCSAAATSEGWATGWILFHDRNNDGVRDATDPLLRIQARHPRIDSIEGTPTTFRFGATGRLLAPGPVGNLHFGGSNLDTAIRRVVCITAAGRARIAGDGTANCGTEG